MSRDDQPDFSSEPSQRFPFRTATGFEEVTSCALCKSRVGKLVLTPRHHCRVCMRTVCGSCSKGKIRISDQNGLQRVCDECSKDCGQVPVLDSQFSMLTEQLHKLCGYTSADAKPSLDSGLTCIQLVKDAMDDLKDDAAKEGLARQRLQAELAETEDEVWHIAALAARALPFAARVVNIDIMRDSSGSDGFDFDPATMRITMVDERRQNLCDKIKAGDAIIAVNGVHVCNLTEYHREAKDVLSFILTIWQNKQAGEI